MASENGQTGEHGEDAHGPRECMPCRGSGRVISNLGGTQRTLECPWCGGRGVRASGIDAQEHWREGDAGNGAADGAAAVDAGAAPAPSTDQAPGSAA